MADDDAHEQSIEVNDKVADRKDTEHAETDRIDADNS